MPAAPVTCAHHPDEIICTSTHCLPLGETLAYRPRVSDLMACPRDWRGAPYRENVILSRRRGAEPRMYLRACKRDAPDPLQPVDEATQVSCAMGRTPPGRCPNGLCGPNSAEGIRVMQRYCGVGDRILNDSTCAAWANLRPFEHKQMFETACSDHNNIGTPNCRRYWIDNPGRCKTMASWCAREENRSDSMCSCINSPLLMLPDSIRPPPTCFDSTCTVFGYKPSAHSPGVNRAPCPTFMNCKQIIDVADNAVLNNVSVQQSCSVEIAKKQVATPNYAGDDVVDAPSPDMEELVAPPAFEEVGGANSINNNVLIPKPTHQTQTSQIQMADVVNAAIDVATSNILVLIVLLAVVLMIGRQIFSIFAGRRLQNVGTVAQSTM